MKAYLLALALAATPALAAPDAAALFRAGQFPAAATAGQREGTPAALTLAARSLLTIAAYDTLDKANARALVVDATKLLDRARAARPNDPDIVLQHAIASGYIAKLDNSRTGAKAAKAEMEAARAADPNNGFAYAALGGWNAASIAALGKFVAGVALGAKMSEATRNFDLALAKDPKNPVHPVFYALSLLEISGDDAPKARALLQTAGRLKPRDGFEALAKRKGLQVLALLDRNDVKGARKLATSLQPFANAV